MPEDENQGGSKNESETLTREAAMEALEEGPRAALIISAIAAGILFAGWLFFYFVLFMSRGHVG